MSLTDVMSCKHTTPTPTRLDGLLDVNVKFGDTLPSGSTCPGDGTVDVVGRFSDSQRVADACSLNNSNNKPLRRAQIFDKGVDASMMQVGAYVLVRHLHVH